MTGTFWLSVFRPQGESWDWLRVDPLSGTTRVLASLPGSRAPWPLDARVRPDGAEALVVLRGAPNRVARIDLVGDSSPSIPDEEHDFVVTAGYDEASRPVVVYADRPRLAQVTEAGVTYLVLDGERFAISPERRVPPRSLCAAARLHADAAAAARAHRGLRPPALGAPAARRRGRAIRFTPAAMRALLHHDWPFNIRELERS